MTQYHLRGITGTNNAKLAAVVGQNEERVTRAARESGAQRTYCRAEGACRQAVVDVLVARIPTRLHYAMTVEALQAGKHVLVEKPMAETLG